MECERGVVAEVVPKATVEERRCGADSERRSARVLLPSAELGTRRCADVGRPACSSAAVLLTCGNNEHASEVTRWAQLTVLGWVLGPQVYNTIGCGSRDVALEGGGSGEESSEQAHTQLEFAAT